MGVEKPAVTKTKIIPAEEYDGSLKSEGEPLDQIKEEDFDLFSHISESYFRQHLEKTKARVAKAKQEMVGKTKIVGIEEYDGDLTSKGEPLEYVEGFELMSQAPEYHNVNDPNMYVKRAKQEIHEAAMIKRDETALSISSSLSWQQQENDVNHQTFGY